MSWVNRSVGKKVIMSVTGIVLIIFVFFHLLGNLSIFSGAETLNTYASFLKSLGPAIWISRLVIFIAVAIHLSVGFLLWRENRAARPIPYAAGQKYQKSTVSSRTMIYSGLLLAGFILFHLAHFTLGWVHADIAEKTIAAGRGELYDYVVLSFQYLGTSLLYCAAMVILFLHVRHGFASMFQTLGLTTERLLPKMIFASLLFAVFLLVGYVSIPFSAFFNMLTV